MANPVDYAISHARLTLATLLFLLLAGFSAYMAIPKEAEPDVQVPIIYVNVTQRGISPEDAERLILRPLETQLKTVDSVKEMRSAAFEGGGYVLLEFDAGFDSDVALADVRAKVDDARSDLPTDVDEPQVDEVNLSLFPVLVVSLGGDVPERTLIRMARQAETAIEQVPGVLDADLRGDREEVVEIIAEPMLLKSYGIALDELIASFNAGNSLVAAGALESESGRFAVKVPALIETAEDILNFPIAVSGNAAVTLGDVAEVRPTFKDPTSISRINGKPAITVEVSKRTGANLIETVDATRKVMEELRKTWPSTVQVTYTQDKSKDIRIMLHELQNSVITAVLLVVVIMLMVLGGRASLFIGIAIPASFLAGILGLQLAGLTVNIVVLFSLILAVGMLVDDAIIVSEFAERRMGEGMQPREAYSLAARRMAGPVIAATATRVAAFSPLLFWPGIVGEFMKYMPLTLIATLSASLVVALFFTPTLGAMLGRAGHAQPEQGMKDRGLYMRMVKVALHHPLGDAVARRDPARRRGAGLWPLRQRRRVLPQYRARLRRRAGARARQPLHPGEGPARPHRRRAPADDAGDRDRLCACRRGPARLAGGDRGHRRHHPVRVRRLAGAAQGERHHRRDPRDDEGRARRHHRGDEAAGRPADRQADHAGDRLRRPGAALPGRPQGRRDRARQSRHARRGRRPAAARHRLGAQRRQGRSGEIRREPGDGRNGGAARHQRREDLRIPAGDDRRVRRHPGALPADAAQPRPARRARAQHAHPAPCRSAISSSGRRPPRWA